MNTFSKVPVAVGNRSQQDLSARCVMSTDFGRIDCPYYTELVHGDDVRLNVDAFLRAAPMPAPTFGKIKYDVRVFFVPYRILTAPENSLASQFSWERFIGGLSSSSHPYLDIIKVAAVLSNPSTNSVLPGFTDTVFLKDCRRFLSQMGLPESLYNYDSAGGQVGFPANYRINPFPFAAYQRIFWDYYRDSNLIDETLINSYVPTLVSPGAVRDEYVRNLIHPRYCCFGKDYFTTAKTNAQSGKLSAAASISKSQSDTVIYDPANVQGASGNIFPQSIADTGRLPIQWLRAANSLQKYLERNNLAGSRLMSRFLARFGSAPSSEKLGLSQYLGGTSNYMRIGDVTSNSETVFSDESPFNNAFNTYGNSSHFGSMLGQQSGKMYGEVNDNIINFHADEYGVLMVLTTLIPEVGYYQGLRRHLLRGVSNDKFDYFTPEMENLGYQQVKSGELYFSGSADDNRLFGFVPRYQDYKYQPDVVCGDLVLNGTKAGMDSFHLFRDFSASPSLVPEFTMITPPARRSLDRIFSVVGDVGQYDHFTGFVNINCNITRPMSGSSLPSLDEDLKDTGKTVVVDNGGVRF